MAIDAGSAAVFGRASELQTLGAMLGYARNAQASAIVITGEPGIGKTVLVDELVRRHSEHIDHVVRVAGYASESDMPYACIDLVLRELEHYLTDIPARLRGALEVATGRDVGPPPDRFQVALSLLSLFGATSGATLCVVDDAHLLDEASLAVLAFVARRLRAERVLLILATRPDSATLETFTGIETMTIAGLDIPAGVGLLNSLSEAHIDPRVAVDVVTQLAGHPLAIADLARHTDHHQLALRVLSSEPLHPGVLLQSLYQQEIAALPSGARAFALLAATDSTDDADVVRRSAELLSLTEEDRALVERTGLLALGRNVRFRHQLVRAAVYNSVTAADRRAAHQALEAASREHGHDLAAILHAAACSDPPDETVANQLTSLADSAGARGALLTRAGMLLRASQFSSSEQDRVERAISASESAIGAGAALMARDIISDLDDAHLTNEQRGRGLTVRAFVSLFVADPDSIPDVAPTFLRAADAFRSDSPERERSALLHAFTYMLATDMCTRDVTAERLSERLRALDSSAGLEGAAAQAIGLFLGSDGTNIVPLIRDVLAAIGAAPDDLLPSLGAFPIALSCAIWDPDLALGYAQRLVDAARRSGGLQILDTALWTLSTVHVRLLDLKSANHTIEHVRELRRAIGYPAEHVVNASHLALSGAPLEYAESVASTAFQLGFGGAWTDARTGIGVRLVADGRYDEARESLQAALSTRFPHTGTAARIELVEAAVRSGHRRLAVESADLVAIAAEQSGTPWIQGLSTRAGALLASSDVAEENYRSAIGLFSASQTRGDLARTHLLFGEWLRRQRRRREAREHLAEAARLFDALDIPPFAERARREFAATGEHLPPPSSPTALTPQEALVAKLAEAGKSNQEIAATLFISPNTVDYHLRKVFRKLGVSSRRQLKDLPHE